MPKAAGDPVARFWAKVNKNGPIPAHRPELGPCWVWTGTRYSNGYGRHTFRYEQFLAHRFAYALTDALVGGAQIDHLCKNVTCVRRSHLEQVSPWLNTMRSSSVSAYNASRTHCPQAHPYEGANLYVNPRGDRQCRECRKQGSRRAYLKRRRAALAAEAGEETL